MANDDEWSASSGLCGYQRSPFVCWHCVKMVVSTKVNMAEKKLNKPLKTQVVDESERVSVCVYQLNVLLLFLYGVWVWRGSPKGSRARLTVKRSFCVRGDPSKLTNKHIRSVVAYERGRVVEILSNHHNPLLS